MIEETGQEFTVIQHVYTTDFFQLSAFNPNHQVVSIYYQVAPVQALQLAISEHQFDFAENCDGAQAFRWIALHQIAENTFTLPIDKVVGGLLKKNYG